MHKDSIYNALTALLAVCLVVGNLVFRKFVPLGWFEVSVGLLLFPITFIITDLISECYGKAKARQTLIISFFLDLFVMFFISLADLLPATMWSEVDDRTFHAVFGFYLFGFLSSLVSFFIAQAVDVAVFFYIRSKTNGRLLWLRSNVSTLIAQSLDSISVVSLLTIAGAIKAQNWSSVVISSIAYKAIFSLISTPVLYLLVYIIRRSQRVEKETRSAEDC